MFVCPRLPHADLLPVATLPAPENQSLVVFTRWLKAWEALCMHLELLQAAHPSSMCSTSIRTVVGGSNCCSLCLVSDQVRFPWLETGGHEQGDVNPYAKFMVDAVKSNKDAKEVDVLMKVPGHPHSLA